MLRIMQAGTLEPFTELAVVIGLAAALGVVGSLLRQPLLMAFIGAGILAGPDVLGLLSMDHEVRLLASVGICVLLFVVGLRLDLNIIRSMGPAAAVLGLGQVVATALLGFGVCLALGMTGVVAAYVSAAITFSSTIIVVKLLSDKREIDSLHGRMALGLLIVQDIVVVVVMIVLSTAEHAGDGVETVSLGSRLAGTVARGAALLIGVAILARFVLPPLTARLARTRELLLLFAVSWAVMLASAAHALGFSREVGAFLAGVSLASTPYRETLSGRLASLRDFLLLFFFIELGASLELRSLGAQVGAAVVLVLFTLLCKPMIVIAIMGRLGYRKRTSFLTGVSMGQISEFSLILASLGCSLGHLDRGALGLVTMVGLVTFGLSAYMIVGSHRLYERVAPALDLFEKPMKQDDASHDGDGGYQVVLFGLGRFGSRIVEVMQARGVRVLGADFDPQVLQEWSARGLPVRYADATDPEFGESLPLHDARWVVCAAPELQANLTVLRTLREHGFTGRIAATSHGPSHVDRLRKAGADLVLQPFADAAEQAADLLLA